MTTELTEEITEETQIPKERVAEKGITAVLFSDRTVEVKFAPSAPFSLGERTYKQCVAEKDHNNLIMDGTTVRMLLAKIQQEYAKFQKQQHLILNGIRKEEAEQENTDD